MSSARLVFDQALGWPAPLGAAVLVACGAGSAVAARLAGWRRWPLAALVSPLVFVVAWLLTPITSGDTLLRKTGDCPDVVVSAARGLVASAVVAALVLGVAALVLATLGRDRGALAVLAAQAALPLLLAAGLVVTA